MRHSMVVEIGTGGKSLPTMLTLMRLFSRMDSSVSVQAARCTETLVADHTNVGFFTYNF